ncbi:UNVERIFIED_CONTAM: 5'-methylthioadenosine/S-adenosylhomocysteine nucleosidase [Sesamum radiatum]|uniref:5'-methylthioadenosine/S-adenosylhomocysteine nucleosidase n=1 Tax=Sesamum radiatum TaxID=300843 RepID=A0AAW2TFU7_SESRA
MGARTVVGFVSIIFLVLFSGVLGFPVERRKSLAIIREINRRGPYLGLITVYPPEENAFFASGRRYRVGTVEGKKVIYMRCGVGLVNAAAATQQMVDHFYIKGLIHFGISGNTNSSLSIGDVSIPKQFANTGLWDWLKPNATIPSNDVAQLDFKNYNVPKEGNNSLGRVGYSPEQFYSEAGEPNTPREMLWFQVSNNWLHLATSLEGLELEQCVNDTLCLENKPKVVVGLRGSTANTFLDNAAYRDFIFHTFGVSSTDMESTAVVMTSLSNGFPLIVVRGLSDLAGAQEGQNSIKLFGPLAATNVANVVVQFVKLLSEESYSCS